MIIDIILSTTKHQNGGSSVEHAALLLAYTGNSRIVDEVVGPVVLSRSH